MSDGAHIIPFPTGTSQPAPRILGDAIRIPELALEPSHLSEISPDVFKLCHSRDVSISPYAWNLGSGRESLDTLRGVSDFLGMMALQEPLRYGDFGAIGLPTKLRPRDRKLSNLLVTYGVGVNQTDAESSRQRIAQDANWLFYLLQSPLHLSAPGETPEEHLAIVRPVIKPIDIIGDVLNRTRKTVSAETDITNPLIDTKGFVVRGADETSSTILGITALLDLIISSDTDNYSDLGFTTVYDRGGDDRDQWYLAPYGYDVELSTLKGLRILVLERANKLLGQLQSTLRFS